MAAWYVVTKRGVVRLLATIVAVAPLVVVAFVTLLRNHSFGGIVARGRAGRGVRAALARAALRSEPATMPTSRRAGTPVGAATAPGADPQPRGRAAGRPTRRSPPRPRRAGIETVMLERGDDLEQLARDAIARGADVIGMAGGDGSQALVAGVAVGARRAVRVHPRRHPQPLRPRPRRRPRRRRRARSTPSPTATSGAVDLAA